MKRLREGSWRARNLAILGLVLGTGLVGAVTAPPQAQLNPELGEVRAFLDELILDPAALEEIDRAVEKLGSDRFAERYLASVYLARLPVLPRARLEDALAGAPLDKRLRLEQIFKANTPERTDSMILRAMEAVIEGELEGLLPEIVAVIGGRDLDAGWDVCIGACETAAVESDVELLEGSLDSTSAVVRAGAAAAFIKLRGGEAVDLLKPLVDDEDDRIKLIAAHFLRKQKSHECLKAYAALLMAEEFAVRWEALDALRQISGEDFEFFASADRVKRVGPAKAWMDWVEESGATADLDFTLGEPEELVLFNGKDLEGWKEVKAFFREPNRGRPDQGSGWGVEEGKLICFGGRPGHLRTRALYRNYILKLEYRLPGGKGDSGVGLFLTGPNKVRPNCLEVQIVHGHAGDLYPVGGFQAAGADGKEIVYRAERIAEPRELRDEWNSMELKVRDGTLEVSLNGDVVNRASGGPEGKTQLTLLNQSTRVEFRGIVLSPLE
ncbi:MAG: DUF1080 domain-containing protein [Verrucomicrobiales bacterium]